jgi:hypothetical protein
LLISLAHEAQRPSQRHAGPMEVGLDRALGAVEQLGDLRHRAVVDVVQGDVGLALRKAANKAPQLRIVARQLDLVRAPAGPQPTQGTGLAAGTPAARRNPVGDDFAGPGAGLVEANHPIPGRPRGGQRLVRQLLCDR